MNRVYTLEGPVTTRRIVINPEGRVAHRLYVGDSVEGGEPWSEITRHRAAILLWDAMHSPAIVIGRWS